MCTCRVYLCSRCGRIIGPRRIRLCIRGKKLVRDQGCWTLLQRWFTGEPRPAHCGNLVRDDAVPVNDLCDECKARELGTHHRSDEAHRAELDAGYRQLERHTRTWHPEGRKHRLMKDSVRFVPGTTRRLTDSEPGLEYDFDTATRLQSRRNKTNRVTFQVDDHVGESSSKTQVKSQADSDLRNHPTARAPPRSREQQWDPERFRSRWGTPPPPPDKPLPPTPLRKESSRSQPATTGNSPWPLPPPLPPLSPAPAESPTIPGQLPSRPAPSARRDAGNPGKPAAAPVLPPPAVRRVQPGSSKAAVTKPGERGKSRDNLVPPPPLKLRPLLPRAAPAPSQQRLPAQATKTPVAGSVKGTQPTRPGAGAGARPAPSQRLVRSSLPPPQPRLSRPSVPTAKPAAKSATTETVRQQRSSPPKDTDTAVVVPDMPPLPLPTTATTSGKNKADEEQATDNAASSSHSPPLKFAAALSALASQPRNHQWQPHRDPPPQPRPQSARTAALGPTLPSSPPSVPGLLASRQPAPAAGGKRRASLPAYAQPLPGESAAKAKPSSSSSSSARPAGPRPRPHTNGRSLSFRDMVADVTKKLLHGAPPSEVSSFACADSRRVEGRDPAAVAAAASVDTGDAV